MLVDHSEDPQPSPTDDLPLVEKYRPKDMDSIISHTEILNTLTNFVSQQRLPHLLFHGPAGTGKTTTILALARKMYGPQFGMMTLELNASDDRGIDTVRNQVKSFAGTKNCFSKLPKLIILDECDAMIKEAQFALRRVVEMYSSNARFCLICNYVNRIIPALQSRCTKMRFSPLNPLSVLERLQEICANEQIIANEEGLRVIVSVCNGDMRKALNILESVWMAHRNVNIDSVYTTIGKPHPRDINTFLETALNNTFENTDRECWAMKENLSLSLADIIDAVHDRLIRIDFPPLIKCTLLDKLARLRLMGVLQEARLATIGMKETLERVDLQTG
ncbi:putative Replication factor C subunit 5 [Blattamonas nauphoetae]|uniref:Replication factor C subunit 5 n=1 Tax=Blattamonas nauphoetae TaxID=2049346 RepID=A0ABQ9XN00_9EUKA|nr:putative Replication factor C subunit 5 [Blattamonas nauphoetae]